MDRGNGLDVELRMIQVSNNCYQVSRLSNEVGFSVIYREKGELNKSKYQVHDREISFRHVKCRMSVRHLSDNVQIGRYIKDVDSI